MRGLIFGAAGQDGSYMAELLHSKGYLVYGVIRKNTDLLKVEALKRLVPGIIIFTTDITKTENIIQLIKKVEPNEVYNFAGVSDVIDPFHNVGRTVDINGRIPGEIMGVLRQLIPNAKYFQASSRLVFGSHRGGTLNESSIKNPSLPYGAAKLSADNDVKWHRQNGLFACSGIFFNHESERRGTQFFTRKVSKGIAEILSGVTDIIKLGRLDDFRDIGYAPEYVEAAWLMMQNETPTDYVIGTGNVISLSSYVSIALEQYGITHNPVVIDSSLVRDYEEPQRADITKIKEELGWESKTTYPEIIKKMVDYDISLLQKQTA